jgi:hypothetical protein
LCGLGWRCSVSCCHEILAVLMNCYYMTQIDMYRKPTSIF